MAYIIKVDGTEEPLENCELVTLQTAVGGFIEVFTTIDNRYNMVVDEEGLLKQKPVNRKATAMLHPRYGGDTVVGDVVIANTNEID